MDLAYQLQALASAFTFGMLGVIARWWLQQAEAKRKGGPRQ